MHFDFYSRQRDSDDRGGAGGEVCARKGYFVRRVVVGSEVCARKCRLVHKVDMEMKVCARKGYSVRRVAGWDRPGASRSVPERPRPA